MNNKKKIFIITVLVVIVFSIYVGLYTHSPYYFLEFSARPYIAEAEEFFRQNSEQLELLTELVTGNDKEEHFHYEFHYP